MRQSFFIPARCKLPTGMIDVIISFDSIVALLALIMASWFAIRQISIMDKQREIFERQKEISEDQKFYQGQQTTISQQQANLLNQQLALIRTQEIDREKKEELFLLISPLYTNFRKDPDIIDWMSYTETEKIWIQKDNPVKEAILKNLEAEILEIMRLRKGLAREPLYSRIDAYEKMMPNLQTNRSEMKHHLDELFESVKIRYNELVGQ